MLPSELTVLSHHHRPPPSQTRSTQRYGSPQVLLLLVCHRLALRTNSGVCQWKHPRRRFRVALTLTTILSLWTWAGHPVHLPVQPCYQWVVQNPPAGIVQALVSAMTSESRRVHVRQSRLRAARVPVLFPTSPSCSGAQCQWLGVALDPPYLLMPVGNSNSQGHARARSEHGTLPVMAVAACRRCVPSPQARPLPCCKCVI
jgi:hypothetical protein